MLYDAVCAKIRLNAIRLRLRLADCARPAAKYHPFPSNTHLYRSMDTELPFSVVVGADLNPLRMAFIFYFRGDVNKTLSMSNCSRGAVVRIYILGPQHGSRYTHFVIERPSIFV